MRFLLANGADLTAKDDKGDTALHYSSQREHLALSKRFGKIELLEKEITFSEVGELFIPEGVNLSTPNQMGLYIQVLEEYMGASNREGGESNVSDASESFKIDI